MPPNHFHMELAKPRIISKPCFLWRSRTCTLNCKQVLTQNNTTLQFFCSRIGTEREISYSTFIPEVIPIFGRSLLRFSKCNSRSLGFLRSKLTSKSQNSISRCQYKIVFTLLCQCSFSFPTDSYIVSCSIKFTLQYSRLLVLTDKSSSMFIVCIPVTRIITMSPCRIREMEFYSRV